MAGRRRWAWLLAIAASCLPLAGVAAQELAEDAKAQREFSQAAEKRDWPAAEQALARLVEINRAKYGPDHPSTLIPLETRAAVVQLAGNYKLSEQLYREALAGRARIGAPPDEQIALDNNGLGQALDLQGRYADAEPFYRKALAVRQKTEQPNSSNLSLSTNNLATNLANGGKLEEAEALFRKALEITIAREGSEGETVAAARLNLGSVLNTRGKYAEAEAEQRKALALNVKAFGPRSAQVGRSYNAVGYALANQGRYAEAEPLIRQAVAIRKAAEGATSQGYFESLNNLASIVQAQGKVAQAEPMFREVLAIVRTLHGNDHPLTLLAESNLALDLFEQSKLDEAIPMLRRVRDMRSRLLGPEHPETATAITNLGEALGRKGDTLGAEMLARQALAITIKAFGEEHDRTASAYSNLAENLMAQGRFDEAEGLHQKALGIRLGALGENHPDTAISYLNLAGAIAARRDYERAQPLLEQALAVFRKAAGPKSLSTAQALNNLAANLNELNRSKESLPLYREALAIRTKLLGDAHPLTASVINNIGYTFTLQGDRRQAAQSYQRAYDIYRKTYGDHSAAGISAANNLAFTLAELGGADDRALELARAETAAVAARRQAIAAGLAAGSDASARAALRARSDTLLDADPAVTAFITLTQIDWIVAGRDPARGEPLKAEAFRAAQQISVSRAGQAMARTTARVAAGKGALGNLVARQQALAERIGVLEAEVTAAQVRGDAPAAEAAAVESRAKSKELAAIDAQIDAGFPDYARLIAPGVLDVAEVQSRLQPDEGLLFIQPSNGDLLSFAISKFGMAWHRAVKRQLPAKDDVEKLLCQVDDRSCTVEAQKALPVKTPFQAKGFAAYDRRTAHGLYRDLVAPVEGALKGVKRLYVTTPGALGKLPFELLVTAPPQGGDDADPATLAATPWLSERYAITVLPSIATLRSLAAARKPGAGMSFRGYGAPKLEGRDPGARGAVFAARGVFRGGDAVAGQAMADPAVLRQLPPLAGTSTELAAMATVLGAPRGAVRMGAAATEAALRSDRDLGRARVLAIATHGLLPDEVGGVVEAGLVLTPPASASAADDGVLTASEASTLRLAADWVILSACNTAAADSSADSLSSLSRAFLLAGARSLLASHWRVSDEATAVLTVETLRADERDTRAVALQTAMRVVRSGKRVDGTAVTGWKSDWAHPMFWAPFSLISTADE